MTEGLWPLDRIDDNPFQTRHSYDDASIAELAADIYAKGLLQPPVGRQVGERLQLAFGHRRLRAYRHIRSGIDSMGWGAMPVNVQVLSDEQMALYAWSENAQRRDITAIEQAQAIQRMVEQFGWSQVEIGSKLGIDRATVANKLRLLRLPDAVIDQVQAGVLSERQATALVPLYDLPVQCLKEYEAQSYVYPKPSEVMKKAADRTSDQLRNDVQTIIQKATCELEKPWIAHEFADRYVKAPACESCTERARVNGALRCPVRTCYERKAKLWTELRLGLASAAIGIPAEPPENKAAYDEWDSLINVPHPDQVVTRHCPNLRLRWTGDDRQTVTRVRVAEYPDVGVICLHGKTGKCTCATQAKAAATRAANQEPDQQAIIAERKRIVAELITPAEAAILEALIADNLTLWQALAKRMSYTSAGDPPTVAGCRERIAHVLLAETTDQWLRVSTPNFGTVKEHAERRLAVLGVQPPWQTTPLEALRRRYERIRTWVEQRRWWDQFEEKLDGAALRGNLDNLNALAAELTELRDASAAALSLDSEIAVDRDLLLRLLPVAEEMVGHKMISTISWERRRQLWQVSAQLLQAEPGSLAFAEALANAEPVVLRYVLAVGGTFDRLDLVRERLEQLEPGSASDVAPLVF